MRYLDNQKILKISGQDSKGWLGSLLTTDISNMASDQFVPTALLTPQGKIIWCGLIAHHIDAYYLTVHQDIASDLKTRLSMYQLRAQLHICITDLKLIHASSAKEQQLGFKDARLKALGYLVMGTNPATPSHDTHYEKLHYDLGLLRQGIDFGEAEIFPHDIGLEKLGGVDFAKGCYVGQEVVSRMQHKGGARKRPVCIRADQAIDNVHKGSHLIQNHKKIGYLTSAYKKRGVGLIRIDKWQTDQPVMLQSDAEIPSVKVRITLPYWLGNAPA